MLHRTRLAVQGEDSRLESSPVPRAQETYSQISTEVSLSRDSEYREFESSCPGP